MQTIEQKRQDCIKWLVKNDSNGVWTDSDSKSEGYEPITLEQCKTAIKRMVEEGTPTLYFN